MTAATNTTVINITTEVRFDVYIGRNMMFTKYQLRQSKWYNPFKAGRDGTLEQVIEKYRRYILEKEQSHYLLDCLPELKGKVLGCWCKPAPCHGDVLVSLVEKYV